MNFRSGWTVGFLACTALIGGMAAAQAPDSPTGVPPAGGPGRPGFQRETPAERLDHLAVLLDLTDEQKAQVQTVLEEERAQVKAAHEQARASGQKPTFEQMRAAHEQAQQDTLAKLTPVLSPTQLKKFQILMEHRPPPAPAS